MNLKNLYLDFELICNMIAFPSVLLHEGYHYVMARMLKIRVMNVVFLHRHHFPISYIELETGNRLKYAAVQLAPFIIGVPLLFLCYPYLKGLVGVVVLVILVFSVGAGIMDLIVGVVNLLFYMLGRKTV
jgi:hypothetical protein